METKGNRIYQLINIKRYLLNIIGLQLSLASRLLVIISQKCAIKIKMYDFLEEYFEINSNNPSDSPITEFFNGKCVLLTGCTGFLGELYLEKLLRFE